MKPDCCKNNRRKEEVAQTAAILKLLAEENRLKILCILQGGEHCACQIIKHLGLPQNLVSHHLNKLKKAGLIEGRKEGVWIHYSLSLRGKQITKEVFKLI
ncbi:MAG TPA: metalloregulator ArsR/SmtB family transcription factor [Candidatus Paceibacterota bacterium]|nr:metalloregulator ArsR/SmtB family transcription factor [Candidatus Pacearchaeota archaeon]HRZ50630.1 metalloregulator ArsR/SmtB family transcription factor [Candidatus Paceibacterota bacterium]HSA36473.1 metalloregulator ArsR/SmtB family transcription factor [Candidatus Paceibacterota bacterium]